VSGCYIVGSIMCSLSHLVLLIIGRFVCGLGVGFAGMVAPVLLSELSPPLVRGTLSSMHQLGITVGILFASLVGFPFVR